MRRQRITDDFNIITEQLANLIDDIDITHPQVDSEVFLESAGMISATPTDCIAVGATKTGIEAAAASGMPASAISGDAKDRELDDYDLKSFGGLLNSQ